MNKVPDKVIADLGGGVESHLVRDNVHIRGVKKLCLRQDFLNDVYIPKSWVLILRYILCRNKGVSIPLIPAENTKTGT